MKSIEIFRILMAQSARAVEYTDYISAEGYDTPSECPVVHSAWAVEYTHCISAEGYDSTSVLDIILNNLMARPQ